MKNTKEVSNVLIALNSSDNLMGKYPDLTKTELFAFEGTSDDFFHETNNYYAMRAIETYGSAIRDNSLSQLVAIGRRIELEGLEEE